MIKIQGRYNEILCYADTLEESARAQLQEIADLPVFAGAKIRVMPDVHAGKGCTIGTTMTITDRVVPNMVGVDIGCGMETTRLAEKEIDFAELDRVIRRYVPAGRSIRRDEHEYNDLIDLEALACAKSADLDRARHSIGTLGGGNHFIEVDRNEEGDLYLVIHSGSRHLGTQVAGHYQRMGRQAYKEERRQAKHRRNLAMARGIEAEDLPGEIPAALIPVTGELFDAYIHDMKITQQFAMLNRKAMTDVILREAGLTAVDSFTTIHNYIDTDSMILRKGAVSAKAGEKLLIPINMRDGSLICEGLGNEDWNCSAPHGAGRLMSRKAAKENLSMEEYKAGMEGIFTTSISAATLDEAPMAYKPMDEILANIGGTAKIIERITPVYNFKAPD